MSVLPRRRFLKLAALGGTAGLIAPRLLLADPGSRRGRLVLIILRGAIDGLAVAPPYGDRDYAALRGEFALRAPGEKNGALPLNGFFGLHPALGFLGQCYAARELTVFHALASPYRERSHFDGQDVLENGAARARALASGWLNRALARTAAQAPREAGVALEQNVPLVMRGPAAVTSWSPSRLAALDEDTLARLTDLYAGDALLAGRLADGLAADALAADGTGASMDAAGPGAAGARARYAEVVRATAGFLRQERGPRVAVFDTSGWDTHANEGAAEGQLAGRLAVLDGALATLRQQLGDTWRDTAVLLVTEFGRTAAINGTRGTDHGTATVALLAGGAVAGGRVVADWPGLTARALYQGRDLAPTLDLRALLKGVLHEQLAVSRADLEQSVFPDSAQAAPLRDLMRA